MNLKIRNEVPIKSKIGVFSTNNRTNKIALRNDYKNTCCYCGDHDKYGGGLNAYHLEHFAPKSKFSSLKHKYENLHYSCSYCNISKSNKWPSSDASLNVVDDVGFIDPCSEEYYTHLSRKSDGSIIYNTKLGKYMYEEMSLYLQRHRINYCLRKIETVRKKLVKELDQCKDDPILAQKVMNVVINIDNLFFDYLDFYE